MAQSPSIPSPASIPASAGIGFRRAHQSEFLHGAPAVDWVEVHSEDYFAAGGPALQTLCAIRERYPVSLHGVGLSLGSADRLNLEHLASLATLIDRVQPALVSEHLSWGAVDGRHSHDLLPLPYTEEAVDLFAARVAEAQDRLGRELLIENVSSYLRFTESSIPEPEFLVEVARRSGCRLLLDVNNVYVNASNHGEDAGAYLDAIPGQLIAEIHLAGHSVDRYGSRDILIDTHGDRVCEAVWTLYRRLVARVGGRPTLIEWDTDVPPLAVLLAEARRADRILESLRARAA